ncbi:hypothetical protein Tco_0312321 [Tanacetum coccineum]
MTGIGRNTNREFTGCDTYTKKVFANIKRPGKGFSGRVTPLFPTMMIQASEDMGEDSAAPFYSHSTSIISQPSSSKPQKKKSRRKQRKNSGPTEPVTNEAHVSTPSYDPPQSGENSMQLSELMNLCTSLQEKDLDLEKAETAQAKEIASLKKRVKQLEKKRKLRTLGLKRLRKDDASKQRRKIADLDVDAKVTLVDETQEMNDDNLMFNTDVLEEQEKEVVEKEVSIVDPVTTANVEATIANAPTTTIDELTLAQTLIEIKAVKPKYPKLLRQGKAKNVESEISLKKERSVPHDERRFYDEIQKLFDKEMKRVNTFVDMNLEVVKGSKTRTEESSKIVGDELESDKSKKQKIDEHVEAKKDDDPKEEEIKKA